jgi:hypothetical protein
MKSPSCLCVRVLNHTFARQRLGKHVAPKKKCVRNSSRIIGHGVLYAVRVQQVFSMY